MQTSTNNVIRHEPSYKQLSEGRDEPNIVFMQKS